MGGKYVAYPEYKKTGVSWLPEMPQGWQVTKLKYLISTLESGVSVNAADYSKSEGEFGVLKTSCVYTRKFRSEENKTVLEEEISRVKCPVKSGSIIISRMNTPDLVGAAAYVDVDYKDLYLPDRLWQTVYKDDAIQSSKYVHFFMYLRGFRDRISTYAEGASSSMQNIAKEDFLSINILLPSLEEQQKIANFLDHETAKIDTLIEKQQQLIKLLKEKRQAVISHAVTKGLKPNTPMRDSGVDWLGEVPAHWVVKRAKCLFDFVTSGSRGWADYYSDEGSLFFRITNLTRDTIEPKLESIQYVSPPMGSEGVRAKIKFDDLLISITADLGSVCIANESVEGGYVSQHVSLCRPNRAVASSRWLGYFILSDFAKEQLLGAGYGGTKIQLSLEDIRELWLVEPSVKEQVEIADFIDSELVKFSDVMRRADDQILLLQERRTALISAAVTGKIDVRHFNPEDGQAPEPSNNAKKVSI